MDSKVCQNCLTTYQEKEDIQLQLTQHQNKVKELQAQLDTLSQVRGNAERDELRKQQIED